MAEALLAACGALVGLLLGLTGAGGSVVAVPLLVLGFGWSLVDAVPVALLATGGAAAFGTVAAWNVAHVRYRAALLMAAGAVLTAPIGLWLASRAPGSWLGAGFGALMLVVAARLHLQARRRPEESGIVRAAVAGDGPSQDRPLCRLDSRGRIAWNAGSAAVIALIGALTGLVSGAFGVGGGFVIVPALREATPLSMHSAIATSLLAIALISGVTLGMALLMGRGIPWHQALPFLGGALLGMWTGRRLAPRLAGARLQQAFAAGIFVLGLSMIVSR